MMIRTSHVAKAAGLIAAFSPFGAAEASILDDVLVRISMMGSSPLSAIMINLAENMGSEVRTPRTLRTGELVIVGYRADGSAVEVQAGPAGVLVTPELATTLQTGLRAGLYPVGSQLYELPPAGQLSLFQEARDGAALAYAQDLLMTRVDGSITNIIRGITLPDLAPVQLTRVYNTNSSSDFLDMDRINTTVLGAVNTGEIVTSVRAEWETGGSASQIGLRMAEVSLGANLHLDEALATTAAAGSFAAIELGGSAGNVALVLNQATNGTAIAGQVLTIVQQQNTIIGEILTTAIGAVNAGSVNPKRAP